MYLPAIKNGLFLQHDNPRQCLPKPIMKKIINEVFKEDAQEKPFDLFKL